MNEIKQNLALAQVGILHNVSNSIKDDYDATAIKLYIIQLKQALISKYNITDQQLKIMGIENDN